jgi:hypothetical protein
MATRCGVPHRYNLITLSGCLAHHDDGDNAQNKICMKRLPDTNYWIELVCMWTVHTVTTPVSAESITASTIFLGWK